MGAWGYGSFENDSALDFLSSLINEKEIKKLVNKKKLESYDYDEIRITAEVLIHLHKINKYWVDQETIDGLIDGLNAAISDKEWIGSWDDSRAAQQLIKQLKKFIKQLQNLKGY